MKNRLLKSLTAWVDTIRDMARADENFDYALFNGTDELDDRFKIAAGWLPGFKGSTNLHISESNPDYALAVKIIKNDGPWTYTDFEMLEMPEDELGEVYYTCNTIELEDDSAFVADMLLEEYEDVIKMF